MFVLWLEVNVPPVTYRPMGMTPDEVLITDDQTMMIYETIGFWPVRQFPGLRLDKKSAKNLWQKPQEAQPSSE